MSTPDYALSPFHPPAHEEPPLAYQWEGIDQNTLEGLHTKLADAIMALILQAMQGFITTGESIFDQIVDFFESIPVIGPLVEALTGVVGGSLDTLTEWTADIPFIGELVQAIADFFDPDKAVNLAFLADWFDDFLGLFGLFKGDLGFGIPGLDLLENIPIFGPLFDVFLGFIEPIFGGVFSGNPLDFFFNILDDVFGILGDPLNLGSGFPILGDLENIPLFGPIVSLLQQLLAFLQGGPLSFIGGGSLVDAFTSLLTRPFFNSSDAVAGGGIWTVDDTVTYNGQGSVKVIADGSVKELVGNPVGVSPGQKITASVRAQWSGLTGSGSPIRLMVWTDQGDQLLDSVPFSASGTFTDFPNNPLSGSYIVASNVTQAAMLLVLEAEATGGTVWFNDQQSNMLPVASVVEDVVGLSGIFDDIFDIFGGTTGSSGKSLANVLDIGKDFFDVLAGILGADFSDLVLRFDEILQIFEAIAGIVVTPITSLVQDVIDRLLNLTTSGLFDSAALTNIANIPVIAQTRITNLVSDLTARLTTTSFDDMRDRLAGSFLGVGSFNVNDNQGLADKFGDFFEVIANAPHNWTNLQNSITRNYQTFDILRGQVVTPIDSIIQGIKTWYDANFP